MSLPPAESPATGPAHRSGERVPPDGAGRLLGEVRVPLSTVRRRAGRRLLHSLATSPHASISVEVDYTEVERARSELGRDWRRRHGISLTYLPFIAAAVCRTLPDFPQVSARLDGEELVLSAAVHLGIAVDLDHQGLVVPVIRDAEQLTVTDLALQIADLASRARARKLSPDDVSGGTYTITNPGPYGTFASSPIINQPQVAILAVDGIARRPVAVTGADGREEIAIRSTGLLTQAFDHRAFDGAYCAAYLRKLAATIAATDWVAAITGDLASAISPTSDQTSKEQM